MTMLGEFLLSEIERRGMSMREFARFVGVNHQVMNKFLDYGKKDVGYPSMEFVIKLAKATNTSAGVILAMIDPTLMELEPLPLDDTQLRVHTERYQKLTSKQRRVVDTLVETLMEVENEG